MVKYVHFVVVGIYHKCSQLKNMQDQLKSVYYCRERQGMSQRYVNQVAPANWVVDDGLTSKNFIRCAIYPHHTRDRPTSFHLIHCFLCLYVLSNVACSLSPAGWQTLFYGGEGLCLHWQTALCCGLMGHDCLHLQEGFHLFSSGTEPR